MSDIGGLKPGTILGEEAKPPFAVLPDPSLLFLNRARRFATLAPTHELGSYLSFLAVLTGAQHEIQADLPVPALPSFEHIGQALEHGMPPVSRALYEPDDTALGTIERLLMRLEAAEMPAASAAAIQALLAGPHEERRKLTSAALKDALPGLDLARQALLLAGLQVHFARMASMLQAR